VIEQFLNGTPDTIDMSYTAIVSMHENAIKFTTTKSCRRQIFASLHDRSNLWPISITRLKADQPTKAIKCISRYTVNRLNGKHAYTTRYSAAHCERLFYGHRFPTTVWDKFCDTVHDVLFFACMGRGSGGQEGPVPPLIPLGHPCYWPLLKNAK